MRIYLKNIPVKFHHGPIWNDGALGFLKRLPQQEEQLEENKKNKMSRAIWDQFLVKKNKYLLSIRVH